MKKITYLLAAAAVFAACNSGNKGYTVTGTVEGAADGDTVYLQTVKGRQLVKLDSAVIANGTFTFEGTQDTAANRYITYKTAEKEGAMMMDFFLENGKKMKATAVGQKFTDFEMQTPEGENVKLSDYVGKGKVVLVDFWASWCGPCRREMPNLVEAYAKYKNKNFEIVGVSLDQSGESWKEAIGKLNITWPQMSDLKYWNCEGAKLYAVSSIPHTVLIDGEGTIIARGLHGDELQQKLAEVIK